MTRSAPDRLEVDPVIGWRLWYAVRINDEIQLHSPIYLGPHGKWNPTTPLRAWCPDCAQHSPTLECRCGIHAVRTRDEVPFRGGTTALITVVLGEVALWGRVIEHEKGWRAEYAYPYSMYVIPPRRAARRPVSAHELAAAFGVEAYDCPPPPAQLTAGIM